MNIRELIEEREYEFLSCYAKKSRESKGRKVFETSCDIRTDFQRDADRITHSKAFRRLMHKTQVFLAPTKDHYRTRLTHTLEVSQIARAISRGLCLNETLTEAIALGHDLGHTPFGHIGEEVLDSICENGFAHNEQSLRVVDYLEKENGLNLTFEVRDGILNHTGKGIPQTNEGKVVRLADRIAYINHDIDDAIRAGVLTEASIPQDAKRFLGETKSARINTLITSAIENTVDTVMLDRDVQSAFDNLHEFMFDRVYTNPVCKSEEGKAMKLVQSLYDFFSKHPDELPNEYITIAWRDGAERAAADYIAGMTDGYALKIFARYFIPSGWSD